MLKETVYLQIDTGNRLPTTVRANVAPTGELFCLEGGYTETEIEIAGMGRVALSNDGAPLRIDASAMPPWSQKVVAQCLEEGIGQRNDVGSSPILLCISHPRVSLQEESAHPWLPEFLSSGQSKEEYEAKQPSIRPSREDMVAYHVFKSDGSFDIEMEMRNGERSRVGGTDVPADTFPAKKTEAQKADTRLQIALMRHGVLEVAPEDAVLFAIDDSSDRYKHVPQTTQLFVLTWNGADGDVWSANNDGQYISRRHDVSEDVIRAVMYLKRRFEER